MGGLWKERWEVIGTSGKPYIVALKRDGTFGCTCPSWIFQKNRPRKDCQHIMTKKFELINKTQLIINHEEKPSVIRSIELEK